MPQTNPQAVIFYLTAQISAAIRARLDQEFRPFKLTATQYRVLSVLQHKDGLSSAEVARRCSVTPQSMSEIIATLTDRGLIVRSEDAANRRVLRIALTPTARVLLKKCDAIAIRMEEEMLSAAGDIDVAMVADALRRMLAMVRD